jgi:hypothetical protein
MTGLDAVLAGRLAKICGMFGSDHAGERAAAAAHADKLIRDNGLSWETILKSRSSSHATTTEEQIEFCLANINKLRQWERGFIYGINSQRRKLSDKQLAVVRKIRGAQ